MMVHRLLLLLLSVALAAGITFPTPISLVSADGTHLAAAWGAPAKATRGVLFVHQAGRTKEDWSFLADKLYHDGNVVLTVDLRGHGANRTATPAELTEADYQAMQTDVTAALAHLEAKGVTRVCIIGAELGANLAINAGVADPKVVSVVLLSPGMEIKGVIASDAVQRFGARPVALVAALDDRYGAHSAQTMDATALGEHTLKLLDSGGKGVKMLNADPTLEGWIVGWVGQHWEAPKAAPKP